MQRISHTFLILPLKLYRYGYELNENPLRKLLFRQMETFCRSERPYRSVRFKVKLIDVLMPEIWIYYQTLSERLVWKIIKFAYFNRLPFIRIIRNKYFCQITTTVIADWSPKFRESSGLALIVLLCVGVHSNRWSDLSIDLLVVHFYVPLRKAPTRLYSSGCLIWKIFRELWSFKEMPNHQYRWTKSTKFVVK